MDELVCDWCGGRFTTAKRLGPVPRYCRQSHRQRAYEARRLERLGATSSSVAVTGGRRGEPVAVGSPRTGPEAADTRRRLEAALHTAHITSTAGVASLRAVVEQLSVALTDAFDSLGLPVIDRDAEAEWALVQPVSQALHEARAILEERTRSTRRLDRVRHELVAAAAVVLDPAGQAARQGHHGRPSLPIVIPGPDCSIPSGVIDCDLEAGTRVVRWYPEGWTHHGELLPVVVGRPADARYRWQDRRVWDRLALDLIVLCCGWRTAPASLPPRLARARTLLGNQLRGDLAVGTWTLEPATVVAWLEQSNVVALYRDADASGDRR